MNDARTEYTQLKSEAETEALRLERRSFWLSNLRLVTFLGALALGGLGWAGKLPHGGWFALASGIAFVAFAVLHDRTSSAERRARLRARLNEIGLLRLDDRFSELPEDGARFVERDHPYVADLDLFGPASLFQRLDATTTRWGEAELVRWLKSPAAPAEVAARQEAVRELAPQVRFRQDLEVEGRMLAQAKPEPTKLLAWAEGESAFAHPAFLWASRILPAWTVLGWLAATFADLPGTLWHVPVVLQTLLFMATAKKVAAVFGRVSSPHEKLLRFEELFAVVERLVPQSPRLQALAGKLRTEGAPPSKQMRRLGRAISFLEMRGQPLFHLPINVFFLWDLHWVCSLERWRRTSGARLRGWFEALGDLEALSSLAGFAFESPDFCWPEVKEGPARFESEGLGHPLLPAARRVVNDLSLPSPGSVLLVTGSNMAGKTTLLRTAGINAVLAQAGGPVCARSLSMSPLGVASSMRVQDSLARGLSFFYAEVYRLKSVLDRCAAGPTLFLLDEVLQGTNTAERQTASKAIILRLSELGAIGGVATHDLGLTALEQQTGGRVRNVHFTDRIQDGEMTFDYRMRPGVVATTNALALLAKVGIEVPVAKE